MKKINEGGWKGWARFNKKQGKELERRSQKQRKAEKNKAIQVRRFGDIEVADDAVRAQESVVKEVIIPKLAMKAAGVAAKTAGPAIAKAAAVKAAPAIAGAAAAYGAKKYVQKKMKDKRDQKIANRAVAAYVKKQNNMNQEEFEYVRDVIYEGEFMNAYAMMKAFGKYKKDRNKEGKGVLPFTRVKKPKPKKPDEPKPQPKPKPKPNPQPNDNKPKPKIIKPTYDQRIKYQKKSPYAEEYPPGAEDDMNKLYKHKTPSAKTMDAMYKDYKKGQAEKKKKAQVHQSYKKGGKNDPRGMGSVLAMGEKFDDIKKRLQDKSNRNKDSEMVKKMQKVAFAHRQEGTYDNYSKRRVPPRVPGDNVKHQMRPKGMSAGEAGRRKLAKVAQGDQNRKLAKAYGIREADGCWDGYKKAGMKKKGNKVVPNCVPEGMGAAYMPQAEKGKTAEREITSKAVMKQLNRNRNRNTMDADTEVPHIRYVQSRNRKTDLTKGDVGRKGRKPKSKTRKTKKEHFGDNPEYRNLLVELGDKQKMTQLFRMGLAKKGELHTMLRAMKRGPDAMKDPKLRGKLYDLLKNLTDIVTKDGQIYVKVRQNVQQNRKDLQDVEEALRLEGVIVGVNAAFENINIDEDMSGMSVSSGHKRSVKQGAGMTKKGVAAYRRRNPGSKLQTAVTTKPSKLKPGSKAANRRKAFCSRSRSWSSERGKAARRRWNC